MVPNDSTDTLCQACAVNHVVPDFSSPATRDLWGEVEKAKRRLIYTLGRLKLAVISKASDPVRGVAFDIKAEEGSTHVLTGHEDGVITLNLSEADPVERERVRLAMRERYRTLLGHFRHEIGHYFWDRWVRDSPQQLADFRRLFGDETTPYAEALKRHYAKDPSNTYGDTFISSYAASHPWEDFAETFAHYLHMEDTLETAHAFGLTNTAGANPSNLRDFQLLMREWAELTIALNALNRSMGLLDAYPFTISPTVERKLCFVDMLVTAHAER
jgi:hypothetical protein